VRPGAGCGGRMVVIQARRLDASLEFCSMGMIDN
jgi:hypothetical protein